MNAQAAEIWVMEVVIPEKEDSMQGCLGMAANHHV